MKIFILLCCLGSIEVFAAPHAQWDKPISVLNNWAYYSNGAITPTDRPDVQLAKQQFYEAFKLAQQQVQQHTSAQEDMLTFSPPRLGCWPMSRTCNLQNPKTLIPGGLAAPPSVMA